MADLMKLSDTRFHPADYKIGRYTADVPSGTTLSEILHAEYFGNCLDRMRPGMEVSVLSEDFALDVRLRVLTTTKTTAKLRVLDIYAGDDGSGAKPAEQPSMDDIEVNFGGPNHKWRYIHGGKVIAHSFATKEDAEEAALAYISTLNS